MAAHLRAVQVRAGAAPIWPRPRLAPWQRGRASHLSRLAAAGPPCLGTEPSVERELLRSHTTFKTLSLLPTNRVYL